MVALRGQETSRECVRLPRVGAVELGLNSEVGPKSEEGHLSSTERVPQDQKPRSGRNHKAGALNRYDARPEGRLRGTGQPHERIASTQ